MSRYTGPTSRINRRFGQNIFPPCKAEERAPYPPGVHGPTRRRKVSEYGVGLSEKQKLRFMYGLNEKQFRLTFARAKRQGGVTGENFLRLLHLRLDNVVYLLGFVRTRRAARQFVAHGHIAVNGHKVNIPSYTCAANDVIEVRSKASSRQLASRGVEENQQRVVPAWLTAITNDTFKGTVNRLPVSEELPVDVNVQLIVEFYSR
ncbi:MAG: 30S ribosomal protein S4 [Puniceicoccales bacterium]|jgi:small subunit ribosomal protein S4|nr:30S ribosomal protein S4 [Puniceicoccales bacterium]